MRGARAGPGILRGLIGDCELVDYDCAGYRCIIFQQVNGFPTFMLTPKSAGSGKDMPASRAELPLPITAAEQSRSNGYLVFTVDLKFATRVFFVLIKDGQT